MSVRLDDQRQVQVAWLWQAEDLLQIKLAGRRIEQVGAAHHIGDALPGVIQHHGQLIGNQAVAAANDEIADLAAQMLAELALHTIDEDVFTIGYAQADGSILEAATGGAAEAGVGARVAFELLARAGARIRQAFIQQPFDGVPIRSVTFALAQHVAVPFEAVALQRLDDSPLGAGHLPWRIDVFHAQQPKAADRTGVEIGSEGRDQRAEVQVAAGGRCKATDVACGLGRGGGGHGGPARSVMARRMKRCRAWK